MNQIQDIKDKYGQQAESIISSGLNLVKKGSKYHCPNVQAHRNGDRNPSMSWDKNALQFHCFGCLMNIDLYGYYREYLNYPHQEVVSELLGEDDYKNTSMQKKRNTFVDEVKKIEPINDECISYIKSRGLTDETISKFDLKTYKGQIAFPYFKYNQVIGYKLRKPLKNVGNPKMTSVTGSKPYLFNIQNAEESTELIICEGEFDAMIIYQSGYKNVVSVGAGANSVKTLIEQAKEYLDKFTYFIVVSDNDEAGSNMDKIFLEEFGNKAKLIDKNLYTKNDINDEFVISGKDKVTEIIESARFKVEGRRDLEKQPYKGLKNRTGNYIATGLPTIDYGLNDLSPRATTLITGRSNGGKSTLVRQVIANAIDKGNKVYLMSGEGDPETFLNELYQSVVGRDEKYYDMVQINKRFRKEPKPEILEKLKKWHYKKLTMFNKGDSNLKTIDELIGMLEMEIKINNCDLVVVDNLMSILSVQASEKLEQQSDFMQKLCDLSKAYNTHIILVLHPNKSYKKGDDMDFEQISGTSDLYNKADNIISVIREYEEEKIEQGINGKIAVLKNRYFKDLPIIEISFDDETGLLLEIQGDEIVSYIFHWNTDNDGFMRATNEDIPF